MKLIKVKKTGLMMLCSVLACTSIVSAVTHTWIDNCSGNLDYLFGYSWCDMDWNDGDNWTNSGYPGSGDTAIVQIDYRLTNNGPWQQVTIESNTEVNSLIIRPAAASGCQFCFGPGATKATKLSFWGPFILEALTITFNATEGHVTVIAGNGAFITTLQDQ